MQVQNLFEAEVYHTILKRIDRLTPQSQRLWGKMTVSQMLKHCQEAFKVPLSSKPLPRHPLGILIGWMMKDSLYNDKPWKKNLPTSRNFIITEEPDFNTAKHELLSMLQAFHDKGQAGIGDKVHPLFGKLTSERWGKSMWKHLDHHLQQFGV
ncbi:MAG TPA: DUF1569 domain-containing protein [Lacibacter sp.]|nr:DUF1569 domain-containing protein [Lacibacter sp.]HMO87843.1 DUF1569 domain-containing protein [Lacibacter sp.]HMP87449.1 DUF1569 domain-containing protein [Lacibacter sp.]